jgi:hypothetical protein
VVRELWIEMITPFVQEQQMKVLFSKRSRMQPNADIRSVLSMRASGK